MFGFAIFSVLFNLIAGLLLLFCLLMLINLVIHRSFKLHSSKWIYLCTLLGSIYATGILGTIWNLSQGANARGNWYDQFIHMPIYGSLLGGYLGKLMGEELLARASPSLRRWLIVIGTAIALAAFYSYLHTGAISYGDNFNC